MTIQEFVRIQLDINDKVIANFDKLDEQIEVLKRKIDIIEILVKDNIRISKHEMPSL